MSSKEPRQCIKCGMWFYDSPLYQEGKYGCRHHACDEIDFITRRATIYKEQPCLIERVRKWLADHIC